MATNLEQVKRKLRDRKLTYHKLSRLWHVTSPMISNVLNGRAKSERIERLIAEVVGLRVATVHRAIQKGVDHG
jgi:hypothetical protein